MPETALAAAEAALGEAELLVKEVRRANVNQRLLMLIMTIMAAVIIGLGFLAIQNRGNVSDLEDNSREDCRTRNGFRHELHDQFLNYNATLVSFSPDPTGPEAVAAKKKLDDSIPVLADVDCNGDGLLTPADYPS